ncbi:MAG: hypothetical protein RLZZ591_2012 [Pseudomonadota bacterium]|jgi:RecB family endonuclease NucS
MPIHHAIRQVGEKPAPLQATQLAAEEQLREMIIQDPRILSNDWLIIGREVHTYASCRLDLLAQSGLISRVWARDSERLCS